MAADFDIPTEVVGGRIVAASYIPGLVRRTVTGHTTAAAAGHRHS